MHDPMVGRASTHERLEAARSSIEASRAVDESRAHVLILERAAEEQRRAFAGERARLHALLERTDAEKAAHARLAGELQAQMVGCIADRASLVASVGELQAQLDHTRIERVAELHRGGGGGGGGSAPSAPPPPPVQEATGSFGRSGASPPAFAPVAAESSHELSAAVGESSSDGESGGHALAATIREPTEEAQPSPVEDEEVEAPHAPSLPLDPFGEGGSWGTQPPLPPWSTADMRAATPPPSPPPAAPSPATAQAEVPAVANAGASDALLTAWTLGAVPPTEGVKHPELSSRFFAKGEALREEPARREIRLRQLVAALQHATEDAKRRRSGARAAAAARESGEGVG